MSDTPRTDIMVTGNSDPTQDEYENLASFCRQLEREADYAHYWIGRLLDDLPQKRDWLDPDIERNLKAARKP